MTDQLIVDGELRPAAAGAVLAVENPSTAETVRRVALGGPTDADAAIASARREADTGQWPTMPPAERADVMRRLGRLLEQNEDLFADLLVEELGALRTQVKAIHVVRPMANYWDQVERGSRSLDEPLPPIEGPVPTAQMIVREPRGVVSAIVPWNFPHFLDLWKVGPALVTGNTVVLKPALETPSVALELGRLALEAGVPPGVLNVVTGGSDVGEMLTTDPRVDMVSFTGSTTVGRAIASAGGRTMKRMVLELGGKSALVALDDADPTRVAQAAMRFVLNCGQGCALMTRLVLHESIHDEVVEQLVAIVRSLEVGPADDETSQVGPLISATHRDRVEGYMASGREQGATVAVGGGRPDVEAAGYYVEPTVFIDVDNGMRIAREEIFGPVLCVMRYAGSDDEAVAIANDSEYGLAGSVWSADVARGIAVARRIRAGKMSVNEYTSSVDGPFGGYKQSGVGRELGQLGIEEFTEVKHLAWGS